MLWVGYLGLYLNLTTTETFSSQRDQTLVEAFHATVLQMALPGVFGIPWHVDGASNSLYPETGALMVALAVVVVLALVTASAIRNGWRAFEGWLLVAGVLAVDFAVLATGRPDFLGLVARDPRYVTDWLPVMVIGACAAFAVPRLAAVRPVAVACGGPQLRRPGCSSRR